MKMIVGLGNIGRQYEDTRHNVGFMTVEAFAKEHQISFSKIKFEGAIAQGMVKSEKVILVEPQTYMNESGRAVRPLMDYFGIELENLIVIQDDLDLAVGELRLRQKGSAGGHNGIKSLIQHLGTDKFKRLKIGIGRPQRGSIVDWVLGDFTKTENQEVQFAINEAVQILTEWVEGASFLSLMNKYN